MTEAANDKARKPAEKFHVGRVHVSIWQNSGVNGAFRAATFQLRYKKDEEKGWQTGQSFGASDLLSLETAAQEARTRIGKWQEGNRKKQAPQAAA